MSAKGGRSQDSINSLAHKHYVQLHTGDGATTEFEIGGTIMRTEDIQVFVAGLLVRAKVGATANDYAVRGLSNGYDGDTNMIKFAAAPAGAAKIDILRVGG